MCGIVGIASRDLDQYNLRENVQNSLMRMTHRGPDGFESFQCKLGEFGAVRLAMNGLSDRSVVLRCPDDNTRLLFNGEIYNHHELQKRVAKLGMVCATGNDGEVILHLYKKMGINCIKLLDGMFSFAIIDDLTDTVYVARDSIGIKPLYFEYSASENRFAFASELSTLVALSKRNPVVSSRALAAYLQLRFVPAPMSIYEGFYKLEQGHILCFGKRGLQKLRYIEHVGPTRKLDEIGLEAASIELEEAINESVDEMTDSEVEIGSFLSGGIDSSLIADAAARKSDSHQVFSVGYGLESDVDEIVDARLYANSLGLKILETRVDRSQLKSLLGSVAKHIDEPILSTVGVPTLQLSRFTRHYVKGALSGDGSDEIFMGYNYLNLLSAIDHPDQMLSEYLGQIGWLRPCLAKQIFDYYDNYNPTEELSAEVDDPWERIRAIETLYRLPDYHLHRIDRLSMAESLEVRVPYLRRKIVDFAFSFSAEDLFRNAPRKLLLRRIASRRKHTYLSKKRKKPFTSPYESWIKTELGNDIEYLFLKSGIPEQLNINIHQIEVLRSFSDILRVFSTSEIWGLFSLFNWYRHSTC